MSVIIPERQTGGSLEVAVCSLAKLMCFVNERLSKNTVGSDKGRHPSTHGLYMYTQTRFSSIVKGTTLRKQLKQPKANQGSWFHVLWRSSTVHWAYLLMPSKADATLLSICSTVLQSTQASVYFSRASYADALRSKGLMLKGTKASALEQDAKMSPVCQTNRVAQQCTDSGKFKCCSQYEFNFWQKDTISRIGRESSTQTERERRPRTTNGNYVHLCQFLCPPPPAQRRVGVSQFSHCGMHCNYTTNSHGTPGKSLYHPSLWQLILLWEGG